MKTYLKQAFLPFIYLIFVAILSLAIISIDEKQLALKIILGVLNVAMYVTVIFGTSYKEGQTALRVRVANDLERLQIIKTGEDRPLKLHEEYKWWKGIIIGALTCAPMILLLIVHTILISINPSLNGCGVATALIYMCFFCFFVIGGSGSGLEAVSPLSAGSYYFALVAVPIIVSACAIAYYLGARKIELQQDAIKERHREIYGE